MIKSRTIKEEMIPKFQDKCNKSFSKEVLNKVFLETWCLDHRASDILFMTIKGKIQEELKEPDNG